MTIIGSWQEKLSKFDRQTLEAGNLCNQRLKLLKIFRVR